MCTPEEKISKDQINNHSVDLICSHVRKLSLESSQPKTSTEAECSACFSSSSPLSLSSSSFVISLTLHCLHHFICIAQNKCCRSKAGGSAEDYLADLVLTRHQSEGKSQSEVRPAQWTARMTWSREGFTNSIQTALIDEQTCSCLRHLGFQICQTLYL